MIVSDELDCGVYRYLNLPLEVVDVVHYHGDHDIELRLRLTLIYLNFPGTQEGYYSDRVFLLHFGCLRELFHT